MIDDRRNFAEPEKYRKFFASYWLLHSALYNLAQGNDNQKKKRFTWAITNYYYSLVFIGRLYSFLVLDGYYQGHTDLVKFYRDGDLPRKRVVYFDGHDFIKRNGINDSDGRSKLVRELSEFGITQEYLVEFGRELGAIKDFRNSNTYDAFVIYGQESNPILKTFLPTASDTVRNRTEKFMKDACTVFYNYWYNQDEHVFPLLIHHDWLINSTLRSLRKQRLDTEYIKTIINRGFYFENHYLLRQYSHDYRRVYTLQQSISIPSQLQQEFERYCSIILPLTLSNPEGFPAKRTIIDKIHEEFLRLIEAFPGDSNASRQT